MSTEMLAYLERTKRQFAELGIFVDKTLFDKCLEKDVEQARNNFTRGLNCFKNYQLQLNYNFLRNYFLTEPHTKILRIKNLSFKTYYFWCDLLDVPVKKKEKNKLFCPNCGCRLKLSRIDTEKGHKVILKIDSNQTN